MHPLHKNIQNLNDYQPRKNLLQDKLVAITGATDGIGRALSRSCAKHGAQLLLLAKNQEKLI